MSEGKLKWTHEKLIEDQYVFFDGLIIKSSEKDPDLVFVFSNSPLNDIAAQFGYDGDTLTAVRLRPFYNEADTYGPVSHAVFDGDAATLQLEYTFELTTAAGGKLSCTLPVEVVAQVSEEEEDGGRYLVLKASINGGEIKQYDIYIPPAVEATIDLELERSGEHAAA